MWVTQVFGWGWHPLSSAPSDCPALVREGICAASPTHSLPFQALCILFATEARQDQQDIWSLATCRGPSFIGIKQHPTYHDLATASERLADKGPGSPQVISEHRQTFLYEPLTSQIVAPLGRESNTGTASEFPGVLCKPLSGGLWLFLVVCFHF